MCKFLIITVFLAARAFSSSFVQCTEARDSYPLDFSTIYETVASLDIETAVTLPPGYTFTLIRPGSIDFINAYVLQNTLFFTRTIDHKIDNVSIICNVTTPSGDLKNLIFKIKGGGVGFPSVYAIHFVENKGNNAEIEALKARYDHQMITAIDAKIKETTELTSKTDFINAMPIFFKKHRKELKKEYKGATAYIDGIIINGGDAFIYVSANVKKDNCDIIRLISIQQGKAKIETELVDIHENINGSWEYVYKAPLPFPQKRQSLDFVFTIWSKLFKLSATIS